MFAGTVVVVNSTYRGERAELLGLDIEKFKASVRILSGKYRGREVDKEYEDICKAARQ